MTSRETKQVMSNETITTYLKPQTAVSGKWVVVVTVLQWNTKCSNANYNTSKSWNPAIPMEWNDFMENP